MNYSEGLPADLIGRVSGQSIVQSLQNLCERYPGKVVFSTSFGMEDQAITHLIATWNLPVRIFTLDTGRLFPETYSTWSRTLDRYGLDIEVYFPDTAAVQALLGEKGPNSFYASVENRRECCQIRKVEPLHRALAGHSVWITGIRAEQSVNRTGMASLEWDETHRLVKFHPLYDWSFEQLNDFIRQHNIPYNPLHDKGFVSIGCAPCTRAIQPGEDFRAGRWWWEDNSKKECGLHTHPASTAN